jgi:hypothetical protein
MQFAAARNMGLRSNRKLREDKYKIDNEMDEIKLEIGK